MNYLHFRIDISNEDILQYYTGHAQSISVQTDEGMRVEFPVMHLREFVRHSGIQGYFELCFNEQKRFHSLRKIE